MSMEMASGGAPDASSLVEASVGAGVGSARPAGGPDGGGLSEGADGTAIDAPTGVADDAQPPGANVRPTSMKMVRSFIAERSPLRGRSIMFPWEGRGKGRAPPQLLPQRRSRPRPTPEHGSPS